MAIVKNIRIVQNTLNSSKEYTYVDLSHCGGQFSIKSFRSSDPERRGGASQNLLLGYEQAVILRDELNRFILRYKEAVK